MKQHAKLAKATQAPGDLPAAKQRSINNAHKAESKRKRRETRTAHCCLLRRRREIGLSSVCQARFMCPAPARSMLSAACR